MKTYAVAVLLMFLSTMVIQQNPVGDWSGKLEVQGTQLKIVLHVGKSKKEFTGTLDSPDQSAFGIPLTSISLEDPKIKFEISNLGVVFEGMMEGNEITGKWMQAGQSLSLILVKQVRSEK